MNAVLLALLIAYVPSPTSLLRKAAQRNQQLGRTREVTMSGWLTAPGQPPHPGTLTMRFPSSCKLDGDGAGPASVKGSAAEGAQGPVLKMLQLACPLLTTRGLSAGEAAGTLRAVAEGAGVDLTGIASLGRLGDRAAYVLGAPARDPAKPQLWLYKDSRAPARLVARDGSDLRLLQYGDPAAADFFPRVFELWQAGQLAARFEVLETRGMRGAGEDEDDASRE
jgi:hypothetical protein